MQILWYEFGMCKYMYVNLINKTGIWKQNFNNKRQNTNVETLIQDDRWGKLQDMTVELDHTKSMIHEIVREK